MTDGYPLACRDPQPPDPFEPRGPGRRTKQRPPAWRRLAKRRRRKALARHHRKVMALVAEAKATGKAYTYPKRPPKPR